MFSLWAAAPGSSIVGHGTQVVLMPICASSADARFVRVIANPIDHGSVAQPGLLYVRRIAHGYRVLGDLLTADRMGERPPGVPTAVYASFRTCKLPSPGSVLRALRRHTAPTFTT